MQQFFQNIQGKLVDWVIQKFNFAVDSSDKASVYLKPYLENSWNFLKKIFEYIENSFSYLSNKMSQLFTYAAEKFDLSWSGLEKLLQKSKPAGVGTIIAIFLIVIFWMYMIWHAKRNEKDWKKSWIFVMIILGPLGALVYYIFRKRSQEKKMDEHDKVMMSFFSPMHKNPDTDKK